VSKVEEADVEDTGELRRPEKQEVPRQERKE